jgi:uncharacterized membrane protein
MEHGRPGLAVPGIVLGVGLGGFVDGIVLHQLLQWHHLLSATGDHPVDTVDGLEANTLADGLFHVLAWLATAAGVALVWRAARRGATTWSGRVILGWALVGWGLFDLVEGVVDHHLLGLHHVREGVPNTGVYDVGFLVLGALLVVAGLVVSGASRRRSAPPRPGP